MRPSSTSNANAAGTSTHAASKPLGRSPARYAIASNTAPMPQKALAMVNQSARWKPRIIEKCGGLSMGGSVCGVDGCTMPRGACCGCQDSVRIRRPVPDLVDACFRLPDITIDQVERHDGREFPGRCLPGGR